MRRKSLRLGYALLLTALAVPAGAEADTFSLGPPQLLSDGPSVGCPSACSLVFTQLTTSQPGVVSVAPQDGTITAWRLRAGALNPSGSEYRLRVLRPTGAANQFTAAGRSSAATSTNGEVNSTSLPVKQGDRVGIELSYSVQDALVGPSISIQSQAGDQMGVFAENFADGMTRTAEVLSTAGRLQFNADAVVTPAPPAPPTVPTVPAGPAPPLPLDTTKPSISSFGLTPTRFQAANVGGAVISAVGTRVVFRLSEPGSVRFTVDRAAAGRRAKGKCRKPTRKLRRAKRCTRYVAVKGSFTRAGTAGLNRFRFSGRIGGKALRPGRYRLNARATDPARNVSALRRNPFRIVR